MLRQFLKKNEHNRLKILTAFFDTNVLTLIEIQALLQTPSSTTKRILHDLSNDLMEVSDHKTNLSFHHNFYHIENHSPHSISELIQFVYFSYLEKSVTFNLFIRAFHKPQINILTLCSEVNISQSYCYSKINEINEILQVYNIQLQITNHILTIEGNETSILFFTFLVYQTIDRTKGYEYSDNARTRYSDLLLPVQKKKKLDQNDLATLEIIYKSSLFRQHRKQNIIIENSDVVEVLSMLSRNFDLMNTANKSSSVETKHANLFYNFFVRAFIFDLDSFSERVALGEAFSLITTNHLIRTIVQLVDQYVDTIFVHTIKKRSPTYFELIYSLVFHTCYIDLIRGDYKKSFKELQRKEFTDSESLENSALTQAIQAMVDPFSRQFSHWSDVQQADFNQLLTKLLFCTTYTFQQPKLHIKLDTPRYLVSQVMIKNVILSYFSENMIQFVQHVHEADLVITDQFIPLPKSSECFLLSDFQSKHVWDRLLSKITQLSLTKQINQNNES